MSSSAQTADRRPRAVSVAVTSGRIRIRLADGRDLGIPTSWYPWLDQAPPQDQMEVEVIEGGLGVWWTVIDEGLSVPELFGVAHV